MYMLKISIGANIETIQQCLHLCHHQHRTAVQLFNHVGIDRSLVDPGEREGVVVIKGGGVLHPHPLLLEKKI